MHGKDLPALVIFIIYFIILFYFVPMQSDEKIDHV